MLINILSIEIVVLVPVELKWKVRPFVIININRYIINNNTKSRQDAPPIHRPSQNRL